MPESSTRNAVYVGSFDPPTLGHLDIIQRGSRLFDRLTVGIGINPDKKPLFSPDERIALVGKMVADLPNVDIRCFEGLSVTFAREIDAAVLHISSTLIKQSARMGQDLADSSLQRFVPECVVEPLLDRYRTDG
jgi:pantetheine-phosphate adenylyltransferase